MTKGADEADWKAMVADLSEGVILITPDGRITFANNAALAMHGVERLEDLGGTIKGFRARFIVHDGRHRPLDAAEDPMARAARSESFTDMVVRVDQEIAQELALSHHTVRNHVASLHRKLGVKRRSAVVVWARERGLVDGPDPKRSVRVRKAVKKNQEN